MWSPRLRAQLGLISALIVLVTAVSILVRGREGLKPHAGNVVVAQPDATSDAIAMTSAPRLLGHASH
jgi:hypothetical protein